MPGCQMFLNDGLLYVPLLADEVRIYNASTLTFVDSFGGGGTIDGYFRNPEGIAVDDNYIYVSETGNHRIQKFNKTSPYLLYQK